MLDISGSILLGVVSGLVATFLSVVFRSYWVYVIVPWYEERVYKDAKIEGHWTGLIGQNNYTFHFRRKSHRVLGEMVSRQSGNIYTIEGEFRNMILTLTYTSSIVSAVDRGCLTFLLVNNGKELDGQGAFYYDPDHRITTASAKFTRERV